MTNTFKIAGIQFTGTDNIAENLSIITDYIPQALDNGANFIVLPEICNIVQSNKDLLKSALNNDNSNFIPTLQDTAKQNNIWIHIGSVAEIDGNGLVNRAYMINPNGEIVGTYDKIHMFDVELSDTESYKESDSYSAGNKSQLIKTDYGNYGLSICYDIRFPHLFQHYALSGAEIIGVPACFTYTTGKAHWEALTRARAIENGCFIVAVGQTGKHNDGRTTWGHSMIVNPWGEIIGQLGEECGIVYADIDTSEVKTARNKIPNLKNIKKFQ